MFDDDIPIKTEKGATEIKSRSLGLAQRARTALLLVDGVKPIGELKRLLQASGTEQSVLELLLREGLIRLPQSSASSAPPPVPSRTSAAAAPASALAPAAPQAPASAPSSPSRQVSVSASAVAPGPRAMPDTRVRINGKTRIGATPNTRIRANTRIRVNTKNKSDSAPNTKIRAEAPKAKDNAAGKPQAAPVPAPKPAPVDVWNTEFSSDSVKRQPRQAVPVAPALNAANPDLKLVVARAYLANELDNHLGIQGYILKQKVMECASRTELEGLFESIQKDLTDAFYVDAIDVIRHAEHILGK